MSEDLTVTLGLEGWNGVDAGSRREFLDSLASLKAQTYGLERCEVLVVLEDDDEVDAFLARHLPAAIRLRIPGLTYYKGKNQILQRARGELVVFADSDVRYEPGWLQALVDSFSPAVDAVVGRTRFEPGFLSRVCEVSDWASTRPRSGPAEPFIIANNLALRRSSCRGYRFPEDVSGGGGGAELTFRRWARRRGVGFWFCREAVAYHRYPPFLEKRFRCGAMLVRTRLLDPSLPGGALVRVPLLGPLLLVAATYGKAAARAWILRADLPGGVLAAPLAWLGLLVTKAAELLGAYRYLLASPAARRRLGYEV